MSKSKKLQILGTWPSGGHTPVKGVDYWTEEDKQEIIQEVLEESSPGGGVSDEDIATSEDLNEMLDEIF